MEAADMAAETKAGEMEVAVLSAAITAVCSTYIDI